MEELPTWQQGLIAVLVGVALIAGFALLVRLNPPPDLEAMAEQRRLDRMNRESDMMRDHLIDRMRRM